MAKPQPKQARTALPAGPELAPAPDSGVHYVDRHAAAGQPAADRSKVRSYPQLGTRVPPELYERLQRCCAETGVSQAFLVQRGLDHELEARGY